jgi:glyoxylase-like metal-dependent hydrolase (beta-lactamase superfamily II)
MKALKLCALSFTLAGVVLAGFTAAPVVAQAPPAAPPDYSKVEIQTTQLAPNFYRFEAVGPVLVGNAGLFAGPDGGLMVDAQFAQLTDKLMAAIKKVSDGRIRFLVNTHHHPDHTSGNANFGALGATILSRDELRAHLASGNNPTPPAGLPVITYRGPVTIHVNGDDVQLIPVLNAHTDGDTMVYFPKADVLMTGDFYRSIQYPNVDRNNGGSVKGVMDGLNAVMALAKPTTKIMPGHGPVVDKTAIAANLELITTIRTRVAALIAQGKSQEDVIAAKPLADLDGRVQQIGTTGDRFLGQVYADLKAGK